MKIKTYENFLNESQYPRHPLDTRIDIKHDPNTKEFLSAFREKFGRKNENFPSYMEDFGTHNIDTNIPTSDFGEFNEVFPSWKEHMLDNRSTVNFILALVYRSDNVEGFDLETMESYLPEVPAEVQKFCNKWGYQVYFTFLILKTPGYNPKTLVHDNRLLITFVKDPELVKKHTGIITGRKYGLS